MNKLVRLNCSIIEKHGHLERLVGYKLKSSMLGDYEPFFLNVNLVTAFKMAKQWLSSRGFDSTIKVEKPNNQQFNKQKKFLNEIN